MKAIAFSFETFILRAREHRLNLSSLKRLPFSQVILGRDVAPIVGIMSKKAKTNNVIILLSVHIYKCVFFWFRSREASQDSMKDKD